MNDLRRIQNLKTTILALTMATLGLALLFFAKWADSASGWAWVSNLPAFELGANGA